MWPDLHNHVIPGVDDGARNADDGVVGVRALHAQGVDTVVATPHIDGSLTVDAGALERRLTELDGGWDRLTGAMDEEQSGGLAIKLKRGAEVKLDVPEVDLSDPRLRLGGGRTVLVEFPFLSVPPRSAEVLAGLHSDGYQPLLAHPERYQGVDAAQDLVWSWLEAGAFLQINAGALLGRYGRAAMDRARRILDRGWGHCVASDFHCRGVPDLAAARTWIEEWYGADDATLLFEINPERLLNGEVPYPVTPQRRKRSPMERLRELLPWT